MTARTLRSLLPAAEVALAVLTLSVVATFWRVFNQGDWFWELAAFAVVSHAVAAVTRRRGWSIGASAAVSAAAMVVTATAVLYPSTTLAGVPTADTWSAASNDLSKVWDLFQSVQAPTGASVPFILAAGVAVWWAAFVADWAAFRLWVPFEAVVPAGTVFIFASLFAAHENQVAAAMLFILATFVFLLVHRVARQQANGNWVSSDVNRGTDAMLRGGVFIAVAAVMAAAIIGPRVPQADADALVGWRGNGAGPSARTTISPLVEIQPRLLRQSRQEVFTVETTSPSYWRLTALDQFDCQVWSSNGEYLKASGGLPAPTDLPANSVTVQQQYKIEALSTIWLPAAYRPVSITAGGTNARYEEASGTLIVGNDVSSSDGLTYNLQSSVPLYDPNALAAANGPVPDDIAQRDTNVPDCVSQQVRQLAFAVTRGTTSNYAKALALQDYFRNNFTYDLNVQPGQGSSAMDTFLFRTQRGYCEQFAGTYAAMARVLGLPTRVAVGFTPGEQDEADPHLYHVLGLHAHAWPEVYFPGQGWVLFEPTPTRGAPNAEQYTHVAEEQASSSGTATTAPPTTSASSATATTASPGPSPAGRLDTLGATTALTSEHEPSFWSTQRFGGHALIAIAALAVLALLYLVLVPTFWGLYRRRRRQRAVAPDDRVRLAWQESVESVGVLGVAPARSETPAEFADRVVDTVDTDRYVDLAATLGAADFSAAGVTDDDADTALQISDEVATNVRRQASNEQRIRAVLDPRPPERRRPLRRRSAHARAGRDAPEIELLRS
jgi:transglutaminase-like putative cysteine protease